MQILNAILRHSFAWYFFIGYILDVGQAWRYTYLPSTLFEIRKSEYNSPEEPFWTRYETVSKISKNIYVKNIFYASSKKVSKRNKS